MSKKTKTVDNVPTENTTNTRLTGMPTSVLVSRLNELCYTLDKTCKEAQQMVKMALTAICDYDLYISEYENRFGKTQSEPIRTSIEQLKTETLCAALDNLVEVLDFSRSTGITKHVTDNVE